MQRIDDLALYVHPEIAQELVKRESLATTGNLDFAGRRAKLAVDPSPVPDDLETHDLHLPGYKPEDPEVFVRLYRPKGTKPKNTMIFIHGGGFVGGSVNGADGGCFAYARATEANVISVDYRMPQHDPYPAGVHDCYATLQWIASGPDELFGQQDQIAISGSSAGGALAAGLALMARDKGGPEISHLVLISPVLDDRHETPSSQAHFDNRNWSSARSQVCWKAYLGDYYGKEIPVYAAPARETNLAGLPPTTITICEYDPLHDEEVEFARRLTEAGVRVNAFQYAYTCHGCATWAPQSEIGRRINRDIRESMRAGFGLSTWPGRKR